MINRLMERLKSYLINGDIKIEEGERLPVFRMENLEGETVRSEELEDAVLYFFPKAGTPGCTDQSCKFRDEIAEFEKLDVDVYGISTDTKNKLENFRDRNDLNFDLLSDENKEVSEKFGVLTKAGFAERTTIVLEDGIIRKIVRDVSPEEHVEIALDYLSTSSSTSSMS